MNLGRLLWVVGGYLVGTLPSALIVARAKRATALLASAGRKAGETDPHILLWKQLGVGWIALAATMDVLKGLLYVMAARGWGRLDPAWLALTGVALLMGYAYPPYAREMAGRGLATAAGVFLVLLPVEMTVAGLLIVLGGALRATGLFTTIGLVTVPIVAAIQGQPGAFVALSVAVFLIIEIRRTEGLGAVISHGVTPWKALLYRCVFDSSGPPPRPSERHRDAGDASLP